MMTMSLEKSCLFRQLLLTPGESDHNLVFIGPKYLPIVQRIKPKTVLVENWTAEAIYILQGAFECTDWNVFLESAVNINEVTASVVQYIKFCMDYCIPTKRCTTTICGLLNTLK